MRELINMLLYITFTMLIACSVDSHFDDAILVDSDVIRHGSLNVENCNQAVYVALDQFDSFTNLIHRVHDIACNDSIPTIAINDKGRNIELGLSNPCWVGVACILIKSRNILKIHDEEIRHGAVYDLSAINDELCKHYRNDKFYQSPIYSETPHNLIIKILYEEKSFTGLENVLLQLVKAYELQNVDVPLKVWLERYVPPPPGFSE